MRDDFVTPLSHLTMQTETEPVAVSVTGDSVALCLRLEDCFRLRLKVSRYCGTRNHLVRNHTPARPPSFFEPAWRSMNAAERTPVRPRAVLASDAALRPSSESMIRVVRRVPAGRQRFPRASGRDDPVRRERT